MKQDDKSYNFGRRAGPINPAQMLVAVIVCLLLCPAQAAELQENPELDALFQNRGVSGTFVLYDVARDNWTAHNPVRARMRYIPASTFKVANSLIGLATGAVKSVDEVLPFGGEPQPIKSWENDMGLREAISISNVPVYQELARRIGLERMRKNLALIPYGNTQTGNTVDTFWLQGPLQISALEQARFVARLAQDELPFSAAVQANVREILLLEQDDDRFLYAKTGWATAPDPDIGWWVGWVTRDGRVYSFALNIDMPDRSYIATRVELGKACLALLGIY